MVWWCVWSKTSSSHQTADERRLVGGRIQFLRVGGERLRPAAPGGPGPRPGAGPACRPGAGVRSRRYRARAKPKDKAKPKEQNQKTGGWDQIRTTQGTSAARAHRPPLPLGPSPGLS
eukprot:scaffold16569_cov60-Phaeocystis_antarctica.AAC.8